MNASRCGYKSDGVRRCTSSAALRVRMTLSSADNQKHCTVYLPFEVCSEHVSLSPQLFLPYADHFAVAFEQRFGEAPDYKLSFVDYVPLSDGALAELKAALAKPGAESVPIEVVRDKDLPQELVRQMGFRVKKN